ncbi:putative peptidase [Symmachiella dynata]|uniref:Putative peptidase n=2 Tax=Symmachiella dynata TaxID=2527995 RepID=A0A517ZXX9_9PLAN|nr:putative peptidase [Symmachiella dynata]
MRQRDDLSFPMHEYARRMQALRERMAERGLDAVLITTPENICYLTGFESQGHFSFCALIVPLEGEPIMVPRRLEDSGVQARTWVSISCPYEEVEDPIQKVRDTLRLYDLSDNRIGFEKDCWFFTAVQQERLFALSHETSFVDCAGIVEAGRLIKSDLEIEMIRSAARVAEAGMQAGIEAVQEGATENDVAADIHFAMFKAGGEWPAISPFVATGHRGSIGHQTWAGDIIKKNECVFLEVGGCLKRYHAAMMRTCFVGQPDQQIIDAIKTVQEAVDASIAMIKPGIRLGEVDAVSRKIIARAAPNFGGMQVTRSAYSIGIAFAPDWGEGHIMSIRHRDPRVLQPNMTFHNIPWVQIPGKGGIGLSETIRVTEDGCEVITQLPRQLYIK